MIRKPNPYAQAKVLVKAMKEAGTELTLGAALDIIARQNGHKNWNVMAAATRNGGAAASTSMVVTASAPKTSSVRDTCRQGWCVGDVLTVRPDLYPGEALSVLEEAVRRMDATKGITWDVIETHADWMFPEHRTATVMATGHGVKCMVEVDLANGDILEAFDVTPGHFEISLRDSEFLRQARKLALREDVELTYGESSCVQVADLVEDAELRESILSEMGDPRLRGVALRDYAMPFGMSLSVAGETATLDASGLFAQLEAPRAQRLAADATQDDAIAAGAAEALTALTLALAVRGVEVWTSDFQAALQETTEQVAHLMA